MTSAPWFLVSWVSYKCVGVIKITWFSFSLASFPEPLKPALAAVHACQAITESEAYDRLDRAQARIGGLGSASSPTLTQVQGLRFTPFPVNWTEIPGFPAK